MSQPNVLVTCPPMLAVIEEFEDDFARAGLSVTAANVVQTLTEDELISMLPKYEGWIIGDDPASYRVVEAGASGRLRASVKWGVGVDNVDFSAFEQFGVPVVNTPGVFGAEVADVALTYVLGLARETYRIDRAIRENQAWPKPSGITVGGRKVAVVGFGDIGVQTAKRLVACGADVIAYDPYYKPVDGLQTETATWPDRLSEVDFIIFTCPLNDATKGMFNSNILPLLKHGVRIVNVARGPVVAEAALIQGLTAGIIHSAALDVFEVEPLPSDSRLRAFDSCIFGSHNGSNSIDAVRRVSRLAIEKIANLLDQASDV